jgi:beta-glucosidase
MELKGFSKVRLAPGERRRIDMELGMRDLAAYDADRACWWAEAGEFEVVIAAASDQPRLRARFVLGADWTQGLGP